MNFRAPALETVRAYHERTKHHLSRYAAGPETLDWDAQPDPFRVFEGAPKVPLPLAADRLTTAFAALCACDAVAPEAFSLETIGILLELSLGISAWKEYGPDRWALRCNPSSGNLHPTEGYLICRAIPGLDDGVYHYLACDHGLERRCSSLGRSDAGAGSRLLVGLSSIHWREAWKYGERAFRYCQLDTGHALGALRYAVAALGWRLRWLRNVGSLEILGSLGLDRQADFEVAESEEPELLLEVIADPKAQSPESTMPLVTGNSWSGRANRLDSHPMYHWPVIERVAEATRSPGFAAESRATERYPPRSARSTALAATLIRQRRSAQRFDRSAVLEASEFYALLDALLPRAGPPWDVWTPIPRVHPVLFVHRVAAITPGLYVLPRRGAIEPGLKAALRAEFSWIKPAGCPGHLPLYRLAEGSSIELARTLHCHQAIAADGVFALGMLAEFEADLNEAPWRYRELHWEAGLLGQVLYLEAEALGFRGTGIGCYFDDAFHEVLGLSGAAFQSLYHFTVGRALDDPRILTLPPYAGRSTG